RYLISRRQVRAPLLRRTHWEVFSALDVEAMQAAASPLIGTHDFSSFRAADCEAPHPRRTLRELEVQTVGAILRIEVEGTAFLKHMVRNIVGSLVEVGRGRRAPGWIGEVLAAKDRTRAGPTAPAHGLTLVEVTYGPGPRTSAGPSGS
ncbi:MAG TPA: tRNA pseudouridine(38-40) synthase TruA, partial [Myxococcaceae bacterium]|nr:tRNA pseudouridine(38-40) synthase TruA [Myxococcaceae bacterium]